MNSDIAKAMKTVLHSEDEEAQIVNAQLLALSWVQPVLKEKAALMEYVVSEDEDEQQALFARFADLGKQIVAIGDISLMMLVMMKLECLG